MKTKYLVGLIVTGILDILIISNDKIYNWYLLVLFSSLFMYSGIMLFKDRENVDSNIDSNDNSK